MAISTSARTSRASRYWKDEITVDWCVKAQLLLLSFSTGIQDAVSFPDFRCFASNQTGNTVLFAVALSGAGNGLFSVTNTTSSLAAFTAGAFMAGQIGNMIGGRRRYWQFSSQFVQCGLVFVAGWLQLKSEETGRGPDVFSALVLLAMASGVQVGTARAMDVPEISTAMATAAWVDLMVDKQFFELQNAPRNRRVLFLLALVAGSFAGAFMRAKLGSALAVLISGDVKVVVGVWILLVKGVREGETRASTALEDNKRLACPEYCIETARRAYERRMGS